jgi:glycosyltransferase involved in cell wall biosynthesis
LILPGQIETTDYLKFVEACPFDRILAVSKNVAEELNEYLVNTQPKPTVQTLYLGVNLDVFKPNPTTEKRWDIAFLGRLEPMKAVDLLPEMMSLLAAKSQGLRLLITGDGSLREQILEEFQQRSIASVVDYQGVVPTERIIDLMRASRIILYPSREEPFGLSIVEGMACGVPVISTNRYGPSEIITHLEDGYLVEDLTADNLAEAVITLLENQQIQERMADTARATAERRFDIREHARALESIYAELSLR